MSSGDDLLERLDNARTAHGGTPLDALWADAADRIRTLQASNLRLSGMCHDLTAERDRLQARVRFLERRAVESAKKG